MPAATSIVRECRLDDELPARSVAGRCELFGTVLGGVLGLIAVLLLGFYSTVDGPPFVGFLGGAVAGLGLFEMRGLTGWGRRAGPQPKTKYEAECLEVFSMLLGGVAGAFLGKNIKELDDYYIFWGGLGGLILGAFFGKMLGQMVGDFIDWRRASE
ncbi:MAG: hypothetical protein JNM56_10840 [Planctomycetia bacterium]|nr:hypothetical protein [Planctomycetia bacterium]